MDRASCLVVLCAVFGVLVSFSAAQTEHVVGGGMGWTIPTSNREAYATWASNITFRVNDTLVFNFTTGRHDVLRVQPASYTACTPANAIGNTTTAGPARIALTDAGSHYYICTFGAGSHCTSGQRLNITVVQSSGANPPATAPTTPGTPPPGSTQPGAGGPTSGAGGPGGAMPSPPSPDSSSSTSLAAGFLLAVLSAGLALIC